MFVIRFYGLSTDACVRNHPISHCWTAHEKAKILNAVRDYKAVASIVEWEYKIWQPLASPTAQLEP